MVGRVSFGGVVGAACEGKDGRVVSFEVAGGGGRARRVYEVVEGRARRVGGGYGRSKLLVVVDGGCG